MAFVLVAACMIRGGLAVFAVWIGSVSMMVIGCTAHNFTLFPFS